VRETLAFAARHGIKPMVQLRLLAEADAGLDAVRKGQARYRVVLAA
jgi:D-arabinose 1-dehydrogenase-like Zn-dependent alcohol dehydrogenase